MSVEIALVQFPGSNCDRDCLVAFLEKFNIRLREVWHQENTLPKNISGILLPGGFSYGDYLRGGALAAHSQILSEVKAFADRGTPILGVCNGFQILTESGILPGTLMKNESGLFVCKQTYLKIASGSSAYHKIESKKPLKVPVAHGEGNFYIGKDGLKKLQDNEQIVFQYANEEGEITSEVNPNGSVASIAGITSKNGKILGMMPHPERAVFSYEKTGEGEDGVHILKTFINLLG